MQRNFTGCVSAADPCTQAYFAPGDDQPMKVEICLKKFVVATLCILSCGAYVRAQSDPAPLQIGSVTFSGNIRERYEVWNWFPAKGQDFYSYSGTLMRFALSQKRQNFDWTVEFAVPVLLGCQTARSIRRRKDSWGWAPRIM